MRALIVNADDFGLTAGINRAVAQLHAAGVLSSATLMARGPAAEEAISIARATPTLGVGCHVVLADRIIPRAAGASKDRAETMADRMLPGPIAFLAGVFSGRISPEQIEDETAAQIALLQSRGLKLTHIDAHKHLHLFPQVLRPVLRAARAAGIHAVRNPFEPVLSRNAVRNSPLLRRIPFSALKSFKPAFHRIVTEEGFSTPVGTIGLLVTGRLDATTLASLMRNLPQGTCELVSHPGYNDAALAMTRTRLLASRETEMAALRTLRLPDGVQLVSYAGLAQTP